MKTFQSWNALVKKRTALFEGGNCGFKMNQLRFMGVICTVMLFIVYRTTNYQYLKTEMETKFHPFETVKNYRLHHGKLRGLPRGIMQARSDLELRPLWSSNSQSRASVMTNKNLLAMPVGIKQKYNVDDVVKKFLAANFSIILFHYDGNVDRWRDIGWCEKAIHIVADNQTKWWFAKRFLHPDIVSFYDYIFLWDEDLGVEYFDPVRYLRIVKSEGLEISQPALDPNSTEIHHRITIRARKKRFHRRVYDLRGKTKCSNASEGPPCTGFVEGMAPVFSRSAWYCAWHLIQNDLVHGWGVDMKLGYCAQGDRSKKVGVVDSEYIVHKGIQSLGGSGHPTMRTTVKRHGASSFDLRTEIRRQSTWEHKAFKERWNQAVEEDKDWADPFLKHQRRSRQQNRQED
ncbi:hypothetical protein F3Y22_tig00001478pilonHSYRG00471 [Hibiscus syriacus]|uniref:Lysine ketoglutarate reductase trans-splicing-like protein n=1 Tax=Hibiscus syriacus TaxID=106335 RepID=A0A6A3D0H8_HIBSY|nr:uncharacterized protein LOC120127728 [Hibiscus syriacus]KAE8733228.1 hypothetical protein F3Y22_tig00001478pilonHSYRG00471 [Hibiscus syriacus]